MSAFVSTASRIPGRVRRALDRPRGRWLLGALLTLGFSVADRRPCRIRWTKSEWSYRYDGQTILSNQLLRPRTDIDADLEVFLWEYCPALGDTILDIGAGTGTEAIRLARSVGPTGRVIAVEAHPGTARILEKVGPLNGMANIETVAAAVTDVAGRVSITDTEEPGTNSLFDEGTSIEVPATTIDDLVEAHDLERINFLKMNIEGAERLAIQGMAKSVGRIDRMAISCHDFLGTDWGTTSVEVRTWLEQHDFVIHCRPADPRPWARNYLYASRRR